MDWSWPESEILAPHVFCPEAGLQHAAVAHHAHGGRHHPAPAARSRAPHRRQHHPLGRHARRRLRGVGGPLSRRDRADRRARPADVPGDPGAHQRARPRARRRRRERGRQRRDHGPQPPRLRRVGGGVLEARGARAVPQHVVLRPAAGRRRRPREAEGDHLRRGVRRGAGRRRAPAQALHLVGRAGGGDEGPDARGADRARRPGQRRPARGARQGDHPHLAAPPARRRAPRAASRSRSTRSPPCSPASR